LKAAVLREVPGRLEIVERAVPEPAEGEVLLRVEACGACRTDVHLVDGELPMAELPVVPGHQIVGVVERVGEGVASIGPGERVGFSWLGWTCGVCRYCRTGRENLCERARFTGCNLDGGFAEWVVADARYVFPVAGEVSSIEAAPLLCAGVIGLRTLRKAGDAERIGIYGFGAAAHIVAQVIRWEGKRLFAFTRPGDDAGQAFARKLGAEWAGSSDETPPEPLGAALVFAPAGELVPLALSAVEKGGTVVCGGIHMSGIPSFPYRLLWGERRIESVANLTRADGDELMDLAARIPIRTSVTTFPLEDANEALDAIRTGSLEGAAVVEVHSS
jgi:alcohol dehydrogenase, propanol-preferring